MAWLNHESKLWLDFSCSDTLFEARHEFAHAALVLVCRNIADALCFFERSIKASVDPIAERFSSDFLGAIPSDIEGSFGLAFSHSYARQSSLASFSAR